MDSLIRWSLSRRSAVLLVALLLIVLGAVTASRLPVDVFPDLTAPTVTVITEAHGMAPADLEVQVTFPMESVLNGARSVRRVRSMTADGISVIVVEFDWGTDISEARIIVNERLSLVTPKLPQGVDPPILAPITSIMGEILFLGVVSDKHTATELRTVADVYLRRRLRSIPGVAQVTSIGGGKKQYQVVLSPERLLAYSLSIDDVVRALRTGNENSNAGFVASGGSRYTIRGLGRFDTLEEIEETVIRASGSVPVRLRDVGKAQIGNAPRLGEASVSAERAVILAIQKQPGANTRELTDRLEQYLDRLESGLPEGMRIERDLFRQREFIDIAVANVFHALRDGSILVVVIMALFLASFRATVITLTAIPLSLCATVLVLDTMGATVNTMTLGGIAIAIGALVDDAVIDVENVFRRLRENLTLGEERRPTLQVVFEASVEIRSSIVFATLIVILVFVPIFFLHGIEGRLLQPLGVSYVVSLFASLIVAMTVTPVLCHLLLPSSREVLRAEEPRISRRLKRIYARVLDPVLRRPQWAILPTACLFVLALTGTLFWGRAFLPDFNEGTLTITAMSLPGTSLEQSGRIGRMVEAVLLEHPEVVSTARRTGRAEGDEHVMGAEGTEIEVRLVMQDRSKEELLEALRRDLQRVPGVNINIGQPISHRIDHMLSGTSSGLAVKIFGKDLYELRRLARQVQAEMGNIDGVVDLAVEQQADVPLLDVAFDRAALARYGVSVEHVSHTLEAAVQGLAVSTVLEQDAAFDLVVRLEGPRHGRWDTDHVGSVPVDTPGGGKVPLAYVASIRKDLGPNMISRERVERKIVVQANVAGRDIGSVVADVRGRVDPVVRSVPGYRVEYGGQFESAEQASRVLLVVGLLVVVLVGFLLHTAFGSMRDALFVMANLPLCLIGAVGGVYLSGGVLSVASLIGFITVFGIATRNGILLVSHFRHLQTDEGVADFHEAVRRGAIERLVPVLMTALGTALALVPLVLAGAKAGNEIQAPMAVVILCGLLSSTFLNMVLVPALYLRFGRPARPSAERNGT